MVCNALADDRLTLMGLFMEAHAGLAAEMTRRLERACGISASSFEILVRLARSPEGRLRMTDLASQVALSSSGLTRAVDRLEKLGLVRREPCPTDRRAAYAAITPEGTARIEEAAEVHIEHVEEIFTGLLTADQRAALEEALRIVRDNLNPGALSGAEAQPAR